MSDFQPVELTVEQFHDTQLLRFPAFQQIDGFAHVVTTRPWNMAPHCGPQYELAVSRRRMICEHIGLPFDRLTASDQVHSPHVLSVRPEDAGVGRDSRETAIKFTDGLVCNLPRVPLIQFSADCPLILAVDPRRRAVGTAHASWRGTVTQIATELIRQMQIEFAVNPPDLTVALCPCAGPVEYEVGNDVRRIAAARLGDVERFFPAREGRIFFDMRAANTAQLIAAGVRPDRIFVATASTMTDPRFYSHRRDGADTGRFAVIAGFAS
ncbi:MAG: polyphenol oxidase family protein [Planctomycetota bacterium]